MAGNFIKSGAACAAQHDSTKRAQPCATDKGNERKIKMSEYQVLATGKLALAVAAGTASAWFSSVLPLVLMVCGSVVLDWITGLLAAAKDGKLSSAKGLQGIIKKLALLCLLMLGFGLDVVIPYLVSQGMSVEVGVTLPFGLIVAAWIVLNEALSIIENLHRCGVEVPKSIVKLLAAAKSKEE